MNKARMKEIRELASVLRNYRVPLYHQHIEGVVKSGSDIIKEQPKAKDEKGRRLDPNGSYKQKVVTRKEVDFVEVLKGAYKKGGNPAVQGAFNYIQIMIQTELNNRAIKETLAEKTQPAEA